LLTYINTNIISQFSNIFGSQTIMWILESEKVFAMTMANCIYTSPTQVAFSVMCYL